MSIIPIKILRSMCLLCKLFCSDCLIEVDGKMYCRNDIGNVVREAKEQASTTVAAPAININNVNTNQNTNYNGGMASYPYKSKLVAALLCFFLGFLAFIVFMSESMGQA